jgi:murein DD-endopeptidase MepM/ murein hydrolase activator NlpD
MCMFGRFPALVGCMFAAGLSTAAAAPACGNMLMPASQLKVVGRGLSADHEGIDLVAPYGTPVRAAAAGTVMFVGRVGGYGNLVDLRHRDGTVTRYAHLSRFAPGLQPGRFVRVGAPLGNVGSTGFSTGPHLHFEVLVGGRAVDPKPALALAACRHSPRDMVEEARADERRGAARRQR